MTQTYQKPYYDGSGNLVDLAKTVQEKVGSNASHSVNMEEARKVISGNPYAGKKN